MSDTFIIAAKVRLSKKAVSTWLRSAFPAQDVIANSGEMFNGWYWNGKASASFDDLSSYKLIKHRFAAIADFSVESESESAVVFYDGAQKAVYIYHMMIGYHPAGVCEDLTAIAEACYHRTAKTPDYALFFSETSASLAPENTFSVLEIGKGTARFVNKVNTKKIGESLAPAEKTFFAAQDRGIADSMTDNQFLHPQIRQVAKNARLKKIKKPLPLVDTIEEMLTVLNELRLIQFDTPDDIPWHYTDYYDFKREMMHYARQAAKFETAIVESLFKIMGNCRWEAAVVCLWALNQISLSTHEPAYYQKGLVLFDAHKDRGQGTLRDDRDTSSDHHCALAGNHSPVPGLVKSLRKCLDMIKKGGTTMEEYHYCDMLFHEYGAVDELLALHREYYTGKETLDPHHRDIKILKDNPQIKNVVYSRFFEPDTEDEAYLKLFHTPID